MSLIALDKMGASNSLQTNYFNTASKKLELRESSLLQVNDISEALGRVEYFEAYFTFFQNKFIDSTVKNVVTESISVLIKGISASAFHAFIRLSYALETNNKKEIAYALAYWCSEYNDLSITSTPSDKKLEEVLNDINSISKNHTFLPGIIIDRMNEINRVLKAQQISIQTNEVTLNAIRKLCLDIFTVHNNFTMLHCITVCHAFRISEKYFKNKEEALKHLWEAIVVAYASTQLQYKQIVSETKIIDKPWSETLNAAIQSIDDHVIKLVYSCWQEDKFYQSGEYKFVANRALKN